MQRPATLDHDAHKAWIRACTSRAIAAFSANNAYRERPGRETTSTRMMPREARQPNRQ